MRPWLQLVMDRVSREVARATAWVTARVPGEVLAVAAPLAVVSLLIGVGSALAFRPSALSASAVGPAPAASAPPSPAPSPSETPYVEETPSPGAASPETGGGN